MNLFAVGYALASWILLSYSEVNKRSLEICGASEAHLFVAKWRGMGVTCCYKYNEIVWILLNLNLFLSEVILNKDTSFDFVGYCDSVNVLLTGIKMIEPTEPSISVVSYSS